jgi:hypothetical protein
MKKIILTGTFLLSSFSFAAKSQSRSLAQSSSSSASGSSVESSITPMLGFNQGQIVLGLDHEIAVSSHVGFGGYFAFALEKKEAGLPQLIALGVDAKVHVGVDKWDLYVRPGFGLAFASVDSFNKTYIAPIMGLGVQYALSEKTLFGVERLSVFNWSQKTDLSVETLVATVRIKF